VSTLYYGSLDVTKLLKELKSKHSGFVKGSNGNIYANIKIWRNDEPDRYGNLLSIMLSSKKERIEAEGKVYIGNCKESEYDGPKPVTDADLDEINSQLNDDSFEVRPAGGTQPREGEHGEDSELPF
jgi:hypothetical protein